MDVRTPALILLCSLLFALALAVLGLAADNVSYVQKHNDDILDIHYLRWNQTAEATYSYWLQIDYLPSRFSMTRINAMLGASVVTALAGAGIAVVSWLARGDRSSGIGFSFKKQKRTISLLPIGLIFASVAFIISFAVAIYAWSSTTKWDIDFKKSLPLPPSVTGADVKTVKYESPFDFVPDMWNCWISDYTIDQNVGATLRTKCEEANVAKILMLPVVVLSAALVIGLAFSWWRASRAAAAETETTNKDVDEMKEEDDDETTEKDIEKLNA